MKQKLSPTALRDKRARDLATANERGREIKRAKNQRERRAAIRAGINIEGKDYDHKDNKFKTVKANRGNDGKGTKNEKHARI